MKKAELEDITGEGWLCQRCQSVLQRMSVDISYMGSNFQVELPRCAACGFTFIPSELALGKMREVEKILEDK